MIITAKPRISYWWIVLATLPWVAVILKDKVMGIAFTYSMRKFVDNPAALTLLLTLPFWLYLFIPPIVNFTSDRIWTKWGRRKPFVVVSWLGTITFISLMPLTTGFGALLACYMAFVVFNSLGGPVESLKMEIVPPKQRSISSAVLSWFGNIAGLTFWAVAIGRFDDMTSFFGASLFGDQGLFWTASGAMVIMLIFLLLGIKETDPKSSILKEGWSFQNIFKGIANKHLWPVYILAVSVAVGGTGLGIFSNFLVTEQWGYSKQDNGTNILVGGIINIFLIPLLGVFAVKMGRSRVYLGLVIAGLVVNILMYTYYQYVLYDNRPTLIEMILFGETFTIIMVLTGMALMPLEYDFIPRNEMGTYSGGKGFVTSLTGIITGNLMGGFVYLYSVLFLGPAGEMVHVTFKNDTPQTTVQTKLNQTTWISPVNSATLSAPRLTCRAWYATGANQDHGRAYEIRVKDEDSEKLKAIRDELEAEKNIHKARETYAKIRFKQQESNVSHMFFSATTPIIEKEKYKTFKESTLYLSEKNAENSFAKTIQERIDQIDAELARRSKNFEAQVSKVFASEIMAEGEQILASASRSVIIVAYPLTLRPDREVMEQALDRIRAVMPECLDLRIALINETLRLEVSFFSETATPCTPERLSGILETCAKGTSLAKALPNPLVPSDQQHATAISLDLRIIEDPLDRHPSPVTKVVNSIVGLVSTPSGPERRINALGRSLRRPGWIDHAGAALVPGQEDNAIRVFGLVKARPENEKTDKLVDASDGVKRQLTAFGENQVQAEQFYALAVDMAKQQRMTIARPVLKAEYTKEQYDYLIAYVGVIIMQFIGLGIALYFLHLVKGGKVRRRGLEEAEAAQ